MAAYSFLALDKAASRGITVTMQSIVILVRIYALTAGAGSVFDWERESVLYMLLVLCSWSGLTVGSYMRTYCDSEAILSLLSALLIVSAVSMLGLFELGLFFVGFLMCLGLAVLAVLRL